MTKEEYRQRSIDYLGLEEYICQLSTYQKKGKLRFRDQVKTVADILSWKIIFPALLAMVPFFIMLHVGVFGMLLPVVVGIAALAGGFLVVFCLGLALFHGGLVEIGKLLFLPFVNEQRRK